MCQDSCAGGGAAPAVRRGQRGPTGCRCSSDEEFQATRDGSDQTQPGCVWSSLRQSRATRLPWRGAHGSRLAPCSGLLPYPVSSPSRGPDLCPLSVLFPILGLGLKSPVHTRHCRTVGRRPPLHPLNLGPTAGLGLQEGTRRPWVLGFET